MYVLNSRATNYTTRGFSWQRRVRKKVTKICLFLIKHKKYSKVNKDMKFIKFRIILQLLTPNIWFPLTCIEVDNFSPS